MKVLINLLITAVVAFVLQKILGGVSIASFGTAIVFAIILGLLNMFVKPVIQILSLPLTIVTFGLFSLVINAGIVLLAGYFVDGVVINGWGWAFVFGLLLSIATSILSVNSND